MKKGWDLTPEKFELLLAWLAPGDRDGGGLKYESIRHRLVEIFTCRGWCEAEEMADETINRVADKLPGLAETYVGDPALYFYGVAQNVHREWLRKKRPLPLPPDPVTPRPKEEDEEERLAMECMERCIEELPAASRELIVGYYLPDREAEKHYRKKLAARLKISFNALRIRAHRAKAVLQACVENCVKGAGGK